MSAKLSLIINSAALDKRIGGRSNPHRAGRYAERERLLREEILPSVTAQSWDEILVVGQWESGEGYQYVEMEPRYRDRRDALWQRDLGTRFSTGDVITYCHDDHCPGERFPTKLRELLDGDWDILNAKRVHAATGEELNNGAPKWSAHDGRPEKYREIGYLGSHCPVFRRWVPARIPWTVCDVEHWDTVMSDVWRKAGAKIAWTEDLIHLDLEAAADEH